jgi:hypothetical protein
VLEGFAQKTGHRVNDREKTPDYYVAVGHLIHHVTFAKAAMWAFIALAGLSKRQEL